jgi:hypothetical protein
MMRAYFRFFLAGLIAFTVIASPAMATWSITSPPQYEEMFEGVKTYQTDGMGPMSGGTAQMFQFKKNGTNWDVYGLVVSDAGQSVIESNMGMWDATVESPSDGMGGRVEMPVGQYRLWIKVNGNPVAERLFSVVEMAGP